MPTHPPGLESPRSRRAALGLVAVLTLGASVVLSSPASADPSPGPTIAAPSALLPSWARTSAVTGEREVWLLPVYDAGEAPWQSQALLADVNRQLTWFADMSRGRFSVTATRVLAPLTFDSRGGSTCNAAARVLAPAISAFYAQAPSHAHLVALTRSADCPYSAIGETPGRSVILTGVTDVSSIGPQSLFHELGHNLGLPHSAGYAGGLLSSGPRPTHLESDVLEYGSLADIMGRAGGAPRHSAAGLAALGWGDGVVRVPSGAPGSHRIQLPEVSEAGPDAVIVDDPITGVRYSLTYVYAPRSTAPGLPDAGVGVFLHEVRAGSREPSTYGRGSFSYWMPWEGHGSGSSMGLGAGPGTGWVSPTGGVSMRVESLTDRAASLEVTVDPRAGLTDITGPSWPRKPSIDTTAGSAVAILRLPVAWDQSGVQGYRVTAVGAQVLGLRRPTDLAFPGGATIAFTAPRALVRVVATDGAGNATVWEQRLANPG